MAQEGMYKHLARIQEFEKEVGCESGWLGHSTWGGPLRNLNSGCAKKLFATATSWKHTFHLLAHFGWKKRYSHRKRGRGVRSGKANSFSQKGELENGLKVMYN